MKKYFFIIAMAFFCAITLQADDDKAIKDALLKYNYGIIKMGRTGKADHFKSFTSYDVAIKMQVWFESWKFSNLTILGQINDFRFSPIAYNEDNATIRTLENWTFSYVDLRTREFALEPTNIFYKVQYTLKKHQGEWIIVAVKNLQEEVFAKPNTHKPLVEQKKEKPKENIEKPKENNEKPKVSKEKLKENRGFIRLYK